MKLKIGFDITTCWDNKAFREIMKQAVGDVEQIEMFIITTSDNTNMIKEAQEYLGLDENHVVRCSSMALKIDSIQRLGVMIFVDVDMTSVIGINTLVPLKNAINNVTGCVAIHYNDSLLDVYDMQLKHYTLIQFWIGQISRNLN
jgi:hypothetical protein